MEQKIKYRIVGLIILVSWAIILLPLLYNPHHEGADMRRVVNVTIPEPKIVSSDDTFDSGALVGVAELAVPDLLAVPLEPKPDDQMPGGIGDSGDQGPEVFVVDETAGVPDSWVIQLGSFKSKGNADSLLKKIKKQGLNSYLKKYQKQDTTPVYRVYVGPDLRKDYLNTTLAALEKKYSLDGVVIQYRVNQ